ncbi:MAG: hypothetical protein GF401_08870 [Chitinivibrionales bacterium]|nr:hypothetical protein [Chitinivibrionales bacterium]
MHITPHILVTGLLLSLSLSHFRCAPETGEEKEAENVVYKADLKSLNSSVTGREASGTATLTRKGDSLFISVEATGLVPGIMHLQHYHGFEDGKDADCAEMAQDTNNDSIIDLVETQAVSGITLVPFNADPAALEITTQTYPVADSQGTISYRDTVMIGTLQDAMKQKYGIDSLLLDHRIVYIHGVAPDMQLPGSVQSLPNVPAHVTLPVACGKLRRQSGE